MLDELRNLFLQALKCDDGITATVLVDKWNEAIKRVQDVFDNMTSKVSKLINTRADNIRQMSDDGLAHLFWQISLWRKPAVYNTVDGFCLDDGVIKEKEWLDWLKQEVDDEPT